ncbi:MAG TPA: glycosyltransferase family 4 protein, partial [Thermoanaerobaculia bacterium]|nr:glycosyltransferase family 4 protein [Thermoanaerobaculia bacterium]
MLALRETLRARGHASEIFVEEAPPSSLVGDVGYLSDYAGDAGALLVVHHAIGHASALRLSGLPDRITLWHHGIPPPSVSDDEVRRQRIVRGREQLVFFRERVVGAIADSAALALELEESGYRDVLVVPPDAGEEREDLPREDPVDSAERILRMLDRWCRAERPRPPRPRSPARHVQIQGPFETSYSLAVTNRRLAEALEAHTRYRVTLSCLDGGNGRFPWDSNLADKPRARALFERSFLAGRPDILVRNTYPLRFERSGARIQLAKFYWEETKLPSGWAASFDRCFDGVLVASTWLAEVLRAEAVTVPVAVLPSVVEPPPEGGELPEEVPASRKGLRFLSVSSGFPRKGVDVLLRAFFRAFRAEDDVSLVVKTFPNVHNDVAKELEQMRRADPRAPEVVHIDRDLDDATLGALLRSADALVQPSRGEGFGLPAAEAMLLGIPVLATSATGLADFCREETCLVIPHTFAPSRSHLAE